MRKKLIFKRLLAIVLVFSFLLTSLIVSADEPNFGTIPDLSGVVVIALDGIEPSTSVSALESHTLLDNNQSLEVYDASGSRIIGNNHVGNGATLLIKESTDIVAAFIVKLYGDLNQDGVIDSSDDTMINDVLLGTIDPADPTVADLTGDGAVNISDYLRMRKYLNNTAQINWNRQFAYSSYFDWTDSIAVPYGLTAYETSMEDLSLDSPNINFSFARSYRSDNTDTGLLGVGWTTSFEGSCLPYQNSTSKIIKLYGQEPLLFTWNGSSYICDSSRATLSADQNGYVLTDIDYLTYTFNANGILTSISDANGNTVTITLNNSGKISTVTDSFGRSYTFTYGNNHHLSMVTDPLGRTVQYTYTSQNRLATVTGVMSVLTCQYSYNANNLLSQVRDSFNNCLESITYSQDASLATITDRDSNVTTYTYDSVSNSVTLTKDSEVISHTVYNRYHLPVYSSDSDSTTETMYANTYGDVVYTDSDDQTVQYSYDTSGNMLKAVTDNGETVNTETYTYNTAGDLLTCSFSNGDSAAYTYDANHNLLTAQTVTDETEKSVSYTYNTNGTVQSVVEDGVTTNYTYNQYGGLSGESNSEGRQIAYTRNIIGWLLSQTENNQTTVTYDYNLNGDCLRTTKNNTVIDRSVYDSYGRLMKKISAIEYDASKDRLNNANPSDYYDSETVGVRYSYRANGSLKEIKANEYIVTINNDQHVTLVENQNAELAEYTYTNKNLTAINYVNGQSVAYTYDTDNNLTSFRIGNNTAAEYTYDSEGNLTEKRDYLNATKTEYDGDDTTLYAVAQDETLTEKYAYSSKRYVVVENEGVTENQLVTDDSAEADFRRVTESFGNQTYQTDYYENSLTYGNVEREETVTDDVVTGVTTSYGGNTVFSSAYTRDSQTGLATELENTYGNVTDQYEYTYDDNGNLTSVTRNNQTTQYIYDIGGQLVRVNDPVNNITVVYAYNGVSGNITSVITYPYTTDATIVATAISTVNYTYGNNAWGDLLTNFGGKAITYDALGNLLTYDGYAYTWQAGRRLTSITDGVDSYVYQYDDNGIRTQKTVNGVTTTYTTVDGRITGQYDGTNTLYFRYDEAGSLIGFSLNGTEYFYLKNAQGDIEGILDATGALVVSYTYDAWGKILSCTGTLASTVGQINPMRYRDYYLDSETGYYYLQSRYYNPDFCRFINSDEPSMLTLSADNICGVNLFAYCQNNPVNQVDYDGHDAIYVVDYNQKTGIPIIGHAVLCFQDKNGVWYYTEYTGSNKSNASVSCRKLNKAACQRFFGNVTTSLIALSGTKFIYMKGNFSTCLTPAQKYQKDNFGKYNLITNNCVHYVKKILSYANVSKGLKVILKSKTIIAPNMLGNTLICYYSFKIGITIIKLHILNKNYIFKVGKF